MELDLTCNAYIFCWDETGIESIVPITQYENWDAENTFRVLTDQPTQRNPLYSIIQMMILRARANQQRHYEIYAIDCTSDMDTAFWQKQWHCQPQATADLIRERGEKIYSDRKTIKPVIS